MKLFSLLPKRLVHFACNSPAFYRTGHKWVDVSLNRSYSLKTHPQYCWR